MSEGGAPLRFGVLALPDAPYPELTDRWRLVESLGFDAVYLPDHTGDYRNLRHHWFEATITLSALALATSTIRIGTLVSNPILRNPVLLAKQAVAVDHISGGRLDLGIGTGIAPFDHRGMGIDYWPLRERRARFTEYVELVDAVLRSTGRPFRFQGTYYATDGAPMEPAPVQQPRPPLTLGGQSAAVRRLAAGLADCWNTHGAFGLGYDEILAATREQNRELDEACVSFGRRPADVRRAVLLFGALDPWEGGADVERTVTEFRAAGVSEYVVQFPPEGRRRELERIMTHLVPRLR